MDDAVLPEWQQGYDLATLKTITGIFREAWKPYVFGAFGMPKEVDIAQALAAGHLTYGDNAALWAVPHTVQPTSVTLFTGERITFPAGVLYLKAMAHRHDGLRELLGLINRQTPSTRRLGAEGLWGAPGLDMAEEASLLALDPAFLLPDQLGAIQTELERYEAARPWAQHYSSYNKRHSWTAFCLKGYDATDPGFIIKPAEMSKKWRAENPDRLDAVPVLTSAAPYFPMTLSIVNGLPNAGLQRVRFMRLDPGGGELTRHADITDREAGAKPGKIARLHVPIITNDKVEFASWDTRGRRHTLNMRAGGLHYLDTRKPHTVINSGATPRVHLVVDVAVTHALSERLGLRA